MISRDELGDYLHDYLGCDGFSDYAPNGLQVEGNPSIHRICTAVTAAEAIIKKAGALKADALLTHHGYFWRGEAPALIGMKRRRVGQLITHNMNLFAYHLPLDCHPVVGNNACLADLLGVSNIQMHTAGKTPNLLWSGTLNHALTAASFSELISKKLKRMPLYVSGTEKRIQHVAWCSGAAQDFIEEAHLLGADAYLSGEISERTYYQAQELGLHYFSCGHHATERYGIQALGLHLSEHFALEHQFIDSDNPV
jgi:dinuclear metal center YbgI/SA1388 family protein